MDWRQQLTGTCRCLQKKLHWFSSRKSFEFEDIQGFRNQMATTKSHRLQEEKNGTTGSRLVYTQSEDNIYEDVICMCLCFWGVHSLYLRVANFLGREE